MNHNSDLNSQNSNKIMTKSPPCFPKEWKGGGECKWTPEHPLPTSVCHTILYSDHALHLCTDTSMVVTWMYYFPLMFLWFIYQNVNNSKELWNNTHRYEILHTLNLGCSFITLRELCNNQRHRCDIAWLRVTNHLHGLRVNLHVLFFNLLTRKTMVLPQYPKN